MAKTKTINGANTSPVPVLVEKLVDEGVLSSDVIESIGIVWEYRNLVLHGMDVPAENLDTVRTIGQFELDGLDKVSPPGELNRNTP